MTRRPLFGIAAVVVVGVAATTALALKGGDERPVPTEAQARAVLEAKISQALAGDVGAYCGDTFSPEMCQSQWERLGAKAPRMPPRVVDVREQDGYRVLRVCGTDGQDQPYQTDFVVGLEKGNLTVVLPPVFWTGASFSGVHGDDAPPKSEGVKNAPTASCS